MDDKYDIRISTDQLNLLIRALGVLPKDLPEADDLGDLLFCAIPGDVLNDFTA